MARTLAVAVDEQQRCRGAGRDGCIRRAERRPHVGTALRVATEVRAPRLPRSVSACKQRIPPRSASARRLTGTAPAVRTAPVGDLAAAPRLRSHPSARGPGSARPLSFSDPTRAPLLLCHGWDSRAKRVAMTAGEPRIVGSLQLTADDRRLTRRRASPTHDLAPPVTPTSLCWFSRLRKSGQTTMSDSATVERVVRGVRPEGVDRSARSRSCRLSYGCWPRSPMSIRRGSQRRLGRPSAVSAGPTVTDSTVSLISRRQAANRFAGSGSLSISSGPMT